MTSFVLLWAPALVAVLLALVVAPSARWTGRANVLLSALSLAGAIDLCARAMPTGLAFGGPSDLWRIDALSALFAVCITFVALLAVALGPGFRPEEDFSPTAVRRFRIFVNLFTLAMLAAVTTQNVALMWVAIEATTIASAMVIPLHRTRASLEASWKYILICSVGIALAFTGTILVYFDIASTTGIQPDALNWTRLRELAPLLHPSFMHLAFAFILVGYGTKAGLAPMHTWLPDAHSEAPAPISAMMSGVLLAVALYAIARWQMVVDAAGPSSFAATLLVGAGLLSAALGALSLVIQRHYKRMLAYSSIEHMGLASVGLGLGPLGLFAALLHLLNHAVAKSTVFLLAGRMLHRYGRTDIDGISGLKQAMPWTGSLFAAGTLALMGLPPFGLFVSEFLLVRAAVAAGHPWLAIAIGFVLLTAFVSLVRHLNRMLYGPVPTGVTVGERGAWPVLALTACLGVSIVLGLVLPVPVTTLLNQSVHNLLP